MPETTITIYRDQRAGLYEPVRNNLGSIEDFWIALERTRDFAKAEQLALEFSEDFRLLQDIGWDEHDERDRAGRGRTGAGAPDRRPTASSRSVSSCRYRKVASVFFATHRVLRRARARATRLS